MVSQGLLVLQAPLMRAQLSQGSERGLGPRSASHAEFRGKESGSHPHSGGNHGDEARNHGAQLQSEHNHHSEGQAAPLDGPNSLERTAYHAPTNSYLPVTATGPLNTVGATNRLAGSMALSRDYDYVVQNKKPNPFYKTTAQDYCPKWQLTQDSTIKDYTVPTFDELLRQRQTFFKMEKTLKNEFTNRNTKAQKDLFESKLTEYDKMKLKFDRNAVVAKEFPFKPEEFKQPKPAINVGNELYMTTNMDYGRLAPSAYEISTRWFPNNNTFTREMPGGPYTNQSLKTAVTRNRVHDYLDGFN